MSRKPALVRCNHADDPRCSGCGEDVPHEPDRRILYGSPVEVCTAWGECWPNGIEDDPANFAVRCVKVKP